MNVRIFILTCTLCSYLESIFISMLKLLILSLETYVITRDASLSILEILS